jgi:hypothetical protein
MPELMEVSDSSDSSDDKYSKVDDLNDKFWNDLNEEETKLEVDNSEEAYTQTYPYSMLANATRTNEGVKTELYSSGASHHMTAYQNHLKNYVSIVPKPIAAANK